MCGILGWLRPTTQAIDWERMTAALDRIRHRGPDDEGYLAYDAGSRAAIALGGADTHSDLPLPPARAFRGGANVALGHRRLSIIDLSSCGHQPMSAAEDRLWLVFNGEIYNYIELREQLAQLGHRFRTASDSEVLLAAYRQWGAGALGKLTGMFAFAVLDATRQELFVARDFFGIKPLYFTTSGGGFAFASEIKALLELPDVGRTADAQQTFQYVRFGEREARGPTLFTGIETLPAGHYMVVSLADARILERRRYWDPARIERRELSFAEAVVGVREIFHDSVQLHMRSDVPVGACLSGGLDSSALVLAMRDLVGKGQELHTFSFISEDPRFSEERWIDLIGGVVRHKTAPKSADFAPDLAALFEAQELPFMSLSVYAQLRVFRLAREHGIEVMIDGQGSDEIFAGYSSLIGARITALLARGEIGGALRLMRRLPDTVASMRLRALGSAIGRLLPGAAQLPLVRLADGGVYPPWLERSWFERRGVRPGIRPHGRGRDALHEELCLGIEHLTLPQLLRYEDYNSMHHSIESRVPYCDRRLAEFALSLPDEYLVSPEGVGKHVFREAVRGLVPEPIIGREKFGFPAPDRKWLQEMRGQIVDGWLADAASRAPFLRMEAVRPWLDSTLSATGYWPPQVWQLIGLLGWAQRYDVRWE